MRFGMGHLFLHMTAIGLICAIMTAFIRNAPIVALLCPSVIYGSIYASLATQQFDARIERTMFVGGVSAFLSTFAFSVPIVVNDIVTTKGYVPLTTILWAFLLIESFAILVGISFGVCSDVFHLFITHSNLRRWRDNSAACYSLDLDDMAKIKRNKSTHVRTRNDLKTIG